MSLLDLYVGLNFSLIAPHIGLEATVKQPLSARCPYCEANSWSLHQDTKNLEEWHYCFQCKATGSIFAMAAERLALPVEEAILYLASKVNQIIDPMDLRLYAKEQATIARFGRIWKQAQTNMLRPSIPQLQLLRRLGWQPNSGMGTDRTAEGVAQIFGVTTRPSLYTKLKHKLLCVKRNLVLVPYFKRPGVVGAITYFDGVRELFTAASTMLGPLSTGELGFAGLSAFWHTRERVVVVTSMLSVMITMQHRNFTSNLDPLPLLGWRQSMVPGSARQWSLFAGRQLIMWELGPTAAILHQAILTDAKLVFGGPAVRQPAQEIPGQHLHTWTQIPDVSLTWKYVTQTAKPYKRALVLWETTAPDSEKLRLLQDAEQYTSAVADLVREVMPKNLQGGGGRRVTVSVPTRLTNGRWHTVIVEKNGQWYDLAGGIRLPAIVRVTQLVVRPNGVREYVGYLQKDERRFPFHVPMAIADLAWLRDFGQTHGLFMQTELVIKLFDPRLSAPIEYFDPFDAACRLEPPEVVVGVARVGWDGVGFQFRHARLVDGMLIPHSSYTLPPDAPGPQNAILAVDGPGSESYIRVAGALSSHYPQYYYSSFKNSLQLCGSEMEVTWALATAICAQVSSLAVGLQPLGILIRRRHSRDMFVPMLVSSFNLQSGSPKQWDHHWPRWIPEWKQVRRRANTGFFVAIRSGIARKPGYDLVHIEANDPGLEPRRITCNADRIVLNYLRHFSRQKPAVPFDWTAWLDYTATQMQCVFAFVESDVLRKSRQRITVVQSQSSVCGPLVASAAPSLICTSSYEARSGNCPAI